MKVLVTGSSGFIAGYLVPAIATMADSVTGIDKRTCESNFGRYFTFIKGNILDEEKVKTATEGVDMIVHLAAEHHDFGVPERLFYDVNVDGTAMLLKYAEKNGIKEFVFYSSVAVYGNNKSPSNEEMALEPVSHYGKSKLMAEKIIQQWCKGGRKAVIIRPAVIFGPNNHANMYKLIESIAKKRYINVGDGKNIKSVGYVENIADATMFLIKRMKPGVGLYNYADSPHLEARAMAEIIARALNVKLPPISVPKNLALVLSYPFDLLAAVTKINLPITSYRIKKFTTSTHHLSDKLMGLGFRPRFTIEEGLQKMVNWYVETRRTNNVDEC